MDGGGCFTNVISDVLSRPIGSLEARPSPGRSSVNIAAQNAMRVGEEQTVWVDEDN